jgi:GT2 family glycosyltransferase
MNSPPLVSVIIIFWNAERFFAEAIESVFAQSYNHWELLLIDDGSTDASTEIALGYERAYPGRVRYFEHDGHQNRGKSTSRNLGIFHAKSDYIALLDADDVWFPRKLEQQVGILVSHPEAAMVYGNRQYWWGWTGEPADLQRDYISETGIQPNTLVQPPTLLTLIYALGKATNPGADIVFRREMALHLGGFEEAIQNLFEDQVFGVKVFLNEAVFVSSECWTKYRQHEDSCVHTALKSGQYTASWVDFIHWFEGYLSQHGMQSTLVWHAVQNWLWLHRHPILSRLSRLLKSVARQVLPVPIRLWLRSSWQSLQSRPLAGKLWFVTLRRVVPISRE